MHADSLRTRYKAARATGDFFACEHAAEDLTRAMMIGERHLSVLAVVFAASLLRCAATVPDEDLYLTVMGPYPDETLGSIGYEGGPQLYAAAQLAARHINNNSEVLPGYRLHLFEGDSGCNYYLKAIVDFVKYVAYAGREHPLVGIVGPACSVSALKVAPLATRLNRLQVVTGTSPLLNDQIYPYTYKAVSSSLVYVEALVELMRMNKWKRVAVLIDGVRLYFQSTFDEFTKKLKLSEGVGEIVYTSVVYETYIPLRELKEQNVRVIINFIDKNRAPLVACLAHHLKLTYPVFQWVWIDRFLGNFEENISVVDVDGRRYYCKPENMKSALIGSVLNVYRLTRNNTSETTVANISFDQYKAEYNLVSEGSRVSGYANAYYDAVWSIALAVNKSIPDLTKRNLTLVSAFRQQLAGDNATAEIISRNLQSVDFEGMTGRISYRNDTKDALTVVDIQQVVRNNGMVQSIPIGTYDFENKLVLPSGEFIEDSFEEEVERIHPALSALVLFLNLLLFILTAFLQFLHVRYYNVRTVKATSPNLTHMVFSGCYLFLVASVLYIVQETIDSSGEAFWVAYGVLCNMFTLCFMMGFSLIFGTICAKTWRVYRLFKYFRSQSLRSTLIADEALVAFVCLILLLELSVWLLWTFLDPWILKKDAEFVGDDETPRFQTHIGCGCDHFLQWLLGLSSYKGLLTIVVVALAVLTRRVRRKEFKHTKNVNLLVYVVTLLGGIVIPLYFILQNKSIYFTFIIMITFLDTIIVLCSGCLFLPPIVPVLYHRFTTSSMYIKYRRWRGDNITM